VLLLSALVLLLLSLLLLQLHLVQLACQVPTHTLACLNNLPSTTIGRFFKANQAHKHLLSCTLQVCCACCGGPSSKLHQQLQAAQLQRRLQLCSAAAQHGCQDAHCTRGGH
jgi:hypothetical protein